MIPLTFSMQLLRSDHKDELTCLLQKTESLEIFWFPFNSLFDGFLKKDRNTATLTGILDSEIASGRLVRLVENRSSRFFWSPWNDDLWSREIDFTTDAVTKE